MKNFRDMTPQEEKELIDKLNEDFEYFLVAIPNIEIGEVEGMKTIKLRSQLHDSGFNIAEVLFELQWMLYVRQQQHPEEGHTKIIVSKLELTPDIYSPMGFCPRRGIMITMKYV